MWVRTPCIKNGIHMNEIKSLERRNLDRLKLFYYLRVYDRSTQELVGSVVDISTRGMKLISEKSFAIDSRHGFTILLPEGSIFGESITIDAQCRWCKEHKETASSEAGFEFIAKVESGIYVVKALIADLQKNNML